ncbi:MAG: GNAT family protein [Actinomycetota bacterium]|nr:GNAT family protein [Actinomycetota bacterium]
MTTSFVPPFRSERLVLREIVATDLDEHERLFNDPDVVRYLYDEFMSPEELRAHFTRRLWHGAPSEGSWSNLAVEHEGVFVGEVGLSLASATHRCYEVGYVFLPEYQGVGFATEAVGHLIEIAFVELDAHRVVARLDARNDHSRHLLERLGLRREAHLIKNEFVKGEWTDEFIYAVLEDEWTLARRSS